MTYAKTTPAPMRRDSLTEEGNLSDDLMIPDQDDAQAFLQPAMSAAASHLTSLHTPAIEKAAALKGLGVNGFFDDPELRVSGDDNRDSDGDGDGDTTPEAATSPKSPSQFPRKPTIQLGPVPKDEPRRLAPPSPWKSQQLTKDGGHFSDARGILQAAFEPTRQRSRSAGQEALKKLQQASSHFLPSLPKGKSFLSSFTDSKQSQRSRSTSRRLGQASSASNSPPSQSPANGHLDPNAAADAESRPQLLRRVTSDDSMLYHSLSRASSLGDNDRFTDVRSQVNVRFMAIKDSLPDVPNFKMPSIPSLAKLQAVSRRSTISLNNIFFNEPATQSKQNLDQEPTTSSNAKDDSERLDRVLEELTGDIVIMGGYRGSILRSAEPPHQQLWAPVKLGLNMRKANLEVGLDDEDEETMEERIIPSGMLQHIGPIDISRKFFKKLRSCENYRTGRLRVWDYGYDWRLSPSRLSKRLQDFLQTLPSNQPGVPAESRGAIVVAHSLGGLITRHAVNEQPHLFAGVLYCGTPMRCINILGPLRNGDAVLFNDKLLTAQVNFSIRTSFALLPDDGFCFVDRYTGESYPVDFHNPDNWVRWHLSPCLAPPLPPFNRPATHSPLAALFPNSLWPRGSDGRVDKRRNSMSGPDSAPKEIANNIQNRASMAPRLDGNLHHRHTLSIPPSQSPPQAPYSNSNLPPSPPSSDIDPERFRRNYEYLTRTLASIKQFRSELAHIPAHQDANAYPPLAVIYSKSIPTVYAARVNGRDAIPCADAYDDLVFRPGDGVVLAKESMLPEGYSIAKGGRVSTERGHVSMMGDMPALGKALGALVRGRRKGIGYGAVSPAEASSSS
ncbi:Uncharacterized protein CFAM422_004753 [Trichoderma lentiforme]|uniref:Uncharacterized protein n=1 Tax=Trichoderma lentiforme TaxID=1567552 RepID=A0A9P4XI34_9HYPO|nr:Uncharacterized protein CFAM422_004753 [Trichoderma lentiforme]